jgi:hypothetical protein
MGRIAGSIIVMPRIAHLHARVNRLSLLHKYFSNLYV